MGKHSRPSEPDPDDTQTSGIVIDETVSPEAGGSGPFSLRSHDFKPFYTGGPDPHATDVIERFDIPAAEEVSARLSAKAEPLAAEREPWKDPYENAGPTKQRMMTIGSWIALGFILASIVVAVYIISTNGAFCR